MGPRSDERGNTYTAEQERQRIEPSMGPRSDERGNRTTDKLTVARSDPSMGPRSDERGNLSVVWRVAKHRFPSMGPRSDERGNAVGCLGSKIRGRLQWGRARMSAEIILRAPGPLSPPTFNGAALG